MYRQKEIAVVIPALNEEQSVGSVVSALKTLTDDLGTGPLIDDIVVCDNGSTDSTARVASAAGARVVEELEPGYGVACLTGISALKDSDVVVFVDADNSVVVDEARTLIRQVLDGSDLVVGSRSLGNLAPGAMTIQQRFGNWLASLLIHRLWRYPITDLGPFRAISFKALEQLDMQDRTFGWTVEMQVKAIQRRMNVTEIPVSTKKRIGRSKISGTLSGTIGAAMGIFGMIFKLYLQQKREGKKQTPNRSLSKKQASQSN